MMYSAEYWATKEQHIQKMSIAEMRMLSWICGHKMRDWIKNDDIRDKFRVTPIQEKLVQYRLWWFGHIQRRSPETLVRNDILSRLENTRRGRDRPRLSWEEAIKRIWRNKMYPKSLFWISMLKRRRSMYQNHDLGVRV
jgi:hypothetical protein